MPNSEDAVTTCPRCGGTYMKTVVAQPGKIAFAVCLCGHRFDVADEPGIVGELRESRVDLDQQIRPFRQIADLDIQIKEHEAKVDELKAKRAKVAARALVVIAENPSLKSVKFEDRTVYLHSEVWAAMVRDNDGSKISSISRLENNPGWGFLVTLAVNTQTLSSKVREHFDQTKAEKLPPELDGVVSWNKVQNIRSRKS